MTLTTRCISTIPAVALALALLATAPVPAQAQTATVQVMVKLNTIQKFWNILLRPKTVLADLTCDSAEMEPGEVTTCTVSINQPARPAGATVEVTIPTGFTGPASVRIPGGSASTTFQVTRVDLVGYVSSEILPARMSVWVTGWPARHYAEILVPCCARVDRCGYPASQIEWSPCTG